MIMFRDGKHLFSFYSFGQEKDIVLLLLYLAEVRAGNGEKSLVNLQFIQDEGINN